MQGADDKPTPTVRRFGRYEVKSLVGEGGMGRVYLAEDPVLQRPVAVKVIALDRRIDRVSLDEYLGRFALEARAVARLNHQSIVAVYDAGTDQGVPWIAFEFVDGERLDRMLKNHGPLAVDRAVSIALDIASALQHAHASGIIHRDIKPSNILVDRKSGIAKLSDFGIVKAPWIGLTREGDMVGSPGYMSPEQIDGVKLDGRTDLFSLGVVLYEMIAGKHPFLRDTVQNTLMATLRGGYTPLEEVCDKPPRTVVKAVTGSLRAERDKRTATAAELIGLLASSGQAPPHQASLTGVLGAGGETPATRAAAAAKEHTSRLYKSVAALVRNAGKAALGAPRTGSDPARSVTDTALRWSGADVAQKRASSVHGGNAAGLAGKVLGVARTAVGGVRQRMGELSPGHRLALAIGAGTMASLLVLVAVLLGGDGEIASLRDRVRKGSVGQAVEAARTLHKHNAEWPKHDLAERCSKLIEAGDLEVAGMVAQTIVTLEPSWPRGHVLAARVALRSGQYDAAQSGFSYVKAMGGGKNALRMEQPGLIADISGELMQRRASESLIQAVTTVLSRDDEAVVRSWLQSTNYWLRWNSVKILEAGKRDVDLVSVYILDLSHAGSTRTRIDAARKLGDIGDRRAVPALLEAAARTDSDPRLARAAEDVIAGSFR